MPLLITIGLAQQRQSIPTQAGHMERIALVSEVYRLRSAPITTPKARIDQRSQKLVHCTQV
jgi:hypothetical protein